MAPGSVVYRDDANGVRVNYDVAAPGLVEFSSFLPVEWGFSIEIDGDQDGKWGVATGMPAPTVTASADRRFGKTAEGAFCSQYILSASEQDPLQSYASSICGELPSKGYARFSGLDREDRTTMTLVVPVEEIFGEREIAHVQICVWDEKRTTCRPRIDQALILERPS